MWKAPFLIQKMWKPCSCVEGSLFCNSKDVETLSCVKVCFIKRMWRPCSCVEGPLFCNSKDVGTLFLCGRLLFSNQFKRCGNLVFVWNAPPFLIQKMWRPCSCLKGSFFIPKRCGNLVLVRKAFFSQSIQQMWKPCSCVEGSLFYFKRCGNLVLVWKAPFF